MDMYRRVIEDPLDFPPSWDYDTCSLLSGVSDDVFFEHERETQSFHSF